MARLDRATQSFLETLDGPLEAGHDNQGRTKKEIR
jgi:hypothetical protein